MPLKACTGTAHTVHISTAPLGITALNAVPWIHRGAQAQHKVHKNTHHRTERGVATSSLRMMIPNLLPLLKVSGKLKVTRYCTHGGHGGNLPQAATNGQIRVMTKNMKTIKQNIKIQEKLMSNIDNLILCICSILSYMNNY